MALRLFRRPAPLKAPIRGHWSTLAATLVATAMNRTAEPLLAEFKVNRRRRKRWLAR